jgi:hypothetical protein
LGLDGTDLLIEADCEPPPELLNALRRDKPEILALLRTHEIGEVPLPAATIESPTISRRPGRREWSASDPIRAKTFRRRCSSARPAGGPQRAAALKLQ